MERERVVLTGEEGDEEDAEGCRPNLHDGTHSCIH